jgi:hypothetical protein
MKMKETNTARIFEEPDGYHFCDDDLDYLDARGQGYPNRAAAMRAAYESGYDRVVGSGAYRDGSILGQVKISEEEKRERERYIGMINSLQAGY